MDHLRIIIVVPRLTTDWAAFTPVFSHRIDNMAQVWPTGGYRRTFSIDGSQRRIYGPGVPSGQRDSRCPGGRRVHVRHALHGQDLLLRYAFVEVMFAECVIRFSNVSAAGR